jgi:hypothetical protein
MAGFLGESAKKCGSQRNHDVVGEYADYMMAGGGQTPVKPAFPQGVLGAKP